jgi:hypothetical protein
MTTKNPKEILAETAANALKSTMNGLAVLVNGMITRHNIDPRDVQIKQEVTPNGITMWVESKVPIPLEKPCKSRKRKIISPSRSKKKKSLRNLRMIKN